MRISRVPPAVAWLELPETIIASKKLRGFRFDRDIIRQPSSLFRARIASFSLESNRLKNIQGV